MSLTGKLRRIALNQQGLLRANYFGRGKQATLRAIERLGYVQIDTISVVERAHHHVLWSRVPNYKAKFLAQLVSERKVFEYWFHAASWLPMSDYRFALPRMSQMNGERSWFKNCDQKLVRRILKRVESEGPLRARDFADARHSSKGWWEWKPAKQALEQLFMQGELMVCARQGFQKVYDLPERVLPEWVNTSPPSVEEYASHLIQRTLQAHGFANLKSIAYLRTGKGLRDAIKQQLSLGLENRSLTTVDLGANNIVYIDPELLETRAPRSYAQLRILSPFDNVIIQRHRGREVFAFDFQIECYLPGSKRQYGYFCLPIMYRDRFIGRIDCKAHRKAKLLEVKNLHIEQDVDETLVESLSRELGNFAAFNGCDQVTIRATRPASYLLRLQAHL